MKKFLFSLVLGLFTTIIFANNVQITNLTRSGNTISFDISWENSWYLDQTYHDAVWIFVKQAPNGGPAWQHVDLVPFAVGSGFQTLTPSDQKGIFLRRNTNGNGTSSTSLTLSCQGLIGAFQDLKVMAIEMVYIPEGDFYAGDGASSGRIAAGDDVSMPIEITSDGPLTCGTSATDIQYASGVCEDIPASFPVGYDAFYMMKYSITQQQYVDFLNCLSRDQQENRVLADITGSTVTNYYVMSDGTVPDKGNVIRCDVNVGTGPITFYCDRNNNGIANEADDGMNRACNYLSGADWVAYLDWSGLRPMSFLEAEKASRGPLLPVQNEFSWGSTLWNDNGTLENAGTDSEKWSNSYIDGGISTYDDDVIRVGANAPSSGASRELSNATFYGVIDLGNNPGDFYIHNAYVSTFSAEDGDGILTGNGAANVNSWPDYETINSTRIKIPVQTFGISTLSIALTGASNGGGGRGVRSNF